MPDGPPPHDRVAHDGVAQDGVAQDGVAPDTVAPATALAVNRAMWDERVPIHVASAFYGTEGFRSDPHRLDVRPFEVEELGDVTGRTLLHLQCHFGLDTLSWARLGARVTGLDFSGPAVDAAVALAADVGIDAEFVRADLYQAPAAVDGRRFDVVYTGKGALIWLPDIVRWAEICAALVAPGGTFYLSEFHPVADMFSWQSLELERSYFATDPLFDDSPGTYADLEAPTTHNASYEWQHPLGTVVTALADAGLAIEFLHEHAFTLYPRWPFLVETGDGAYVLPPGMPELPLMYSLRAVKRSP